ncbi:hypothetical protein FSP39_017099 [Pinctada imbricata]|uniref:Uncharacterized protein n=1 Tax=Pinctada imbricata TaxID=66713 RepID=A0AA88Y5E0_PINIB|nr:hypothetical protein FSP39_017099 [Pinctada imbricata]
MNEEENWEEKSDNKRVEYTENSFPSKYPFPSRPFDEEALCRDEPVPTLRSSLCHQKQSRKWSLSPKHSQSVPTRANPMLCFVDSSHKVETVMQRNKHETLTPEQDLSIGNGDKEQNRQSFIGSTTFENAVSDIGDDDCECESICTEDEDDIHKSQTMYPSSDQRTNIQNNENERGKFPQPPQVQRKDFHAIDEVVQNIPRLPLPRRVRIMHEFNIVVSGMAVSEKDIALISLISRCISIFHYEKQTFSSISHLCKKIEAPYDGVYTEDENNETGLFFTETDRDKRGVKILYKSKSKLKLVNFTSRVEDPRGISANDQNVFVCDRNRCSILVFRKDGDLILSISNMYSRFQMPTYVFADGHDRLVISDPSTYSVRVLSGIEDRCTVIDTYTSSNFMLHGQIVPGKCCIDHGRVLIPDKSHREVWNCSNKQKLNFIFDCKLGDGPVAVSRLSSTKIVVATKSGKILVL